MFKKKKKLQINRETVRVLTQKELAEAEGGGPMLKTILCAVSFSCTGKKGDTDRLA